MNQKLKTGGVCGRPWGIVMIAIACACGMGWPFETQAATRDGRAVPGQARQPWGKGELSNANGSATAAFELKEAGSAQYHIISGELLLSESGAALTLPDVTMSLTQDKKTMSIGIVIAVGSGAQAKRVDAVVPGDPKTAWMPFSIKRLGDTVTATLGSVSVAGKASSPASADDSLVVTLKGAARMKGANVTTVPSGMMPVSLDLCAAPSGEPGKPNPLAPPVIDPASLPSGLATVGGVPFVIGGKPVDVRLAMAGSDFSGRLKHGYLPFPPSAHRPVGTVPGNSYEALHILAYSRQIPNHAPRMTVSYGNCVSFAGPMEEEVVPVPDIMTGGESSYVQSRIPVKLSDGKAGWLYHLRIPVARSASAWFAKNTQFEFMRDKQDLHNLPDPNEFGRLPVGLPSSVVVVSATAERAPVEFAYVLGAPGNVFHETQEPVLTVSLANRLDGEFKGRLYARSEGPGTPEEFGIQRSEWTVEKTITLKKGERLEFPIKVMPSDRKKRGWFKVEIGLERDGKPVQVYHTTYAVLAPDTRKAMADSPFGIWEFWWPHSSLAQADRHIKDAATLMNKGGWRWTYGGSPGERSRSKEVMGPEALYDGYKLTFTLRNIREAYQRGKGWWDADIFEDSIAPALREAAANPTRGMDRTYKVLHESRSSDTMLRRYSEFLGGEPYAMPEKEKETVDEQFKKVVQYCAAIKKADPKAKICLINDYPGVGAEYMKRGFPKELVDAFGTEGAMFMREPEQQPNWMCLLGIMQNWKRAQEKYGYQNIPIWTTESLYHGTSPGNLSIHAQGVTQTREALLALANGVERMCAAGTVRDVTDDYRMSNWGQVGFCYREPESNPKPSFAMYAWLTQVLDQAKFAGKIAHDSTSLHILDFKTPAGDHVYPIWCVRGRQEVTLAIKGARPVVSDAYGNPIAASVKDGKLSVTATDTLLYVTGATLEGVVGRKPIEVEAVAGSPLIEFDKAGACSVAISTSKILESNWDYPRIKGDFAVDYVQEDGASAVKIELKDDADPRKLLQRYVELVLAQPIVLKDRAQVFTARVKGNGGWGRVMLELVDAEGRIWTACGNQYAGSCNAADNRGDSYVSFDGWQTLTIRPPGRFPATDLVAYLPSTCNWWPENTPERRLQLEKHQQAIVAYKKALAEFPAVKKSFDDTMQAHAQKLVAFVQAKADQAAAVAAHKVARTEYTQAKAAYDKALKAGQKDAPAPVMPQEPKAAVLTQPAAPKEPVAPKAPGDPRNYGIAALTYPVKLTKVIFAASPGILYVNDEIPVKNRTIYIDRIGVQQETKEDLAIAGK